MHIQVAIYEIRDKGDGDDENGPERRYWAFDLYY
jgi:hypothetical protein